MLSHSQTPAPRQDSAPRRVPQWLGRRWAPYTIVGIAVALAPAFAGAVWLAFHFGQAGCDPSNLGCGLEPLAAVFYTFWYLVGLAVVLVLLVALEVIQLVRTTVRSLAVAGIISMAWLLVIAAVVIFGIQSIGKW